MNQQDLKQSQALSVRLWLACLATQEILCMYLGIRLGLYEALARGAQTPRQLAASAGIAPRYAREWLEQQAVAGIVVTDAAAQLADDRPYRFPESHREVLLDSDSPLSRVAGILPVGAVAHALPALLAAYRTGDGLTDADYGEDWRVSHGTANRAVYSHVLPSVVRNLLPHVHARLQQEGARIADVGCGAGWAAITLAGTYTQARIDGHEIDAGMIEDAQRNLAARGLGDRVHFHLHDCSRPDFAGRYDLVTILDTLHEMPRPVDVLRACRDWCAPNAIVLLMDARVAERFTAPGDEVERFQFTTSVLHCLPVGLAEQPSAATGTMIREPQVRAFAHDAGFSRVDVLPATDRFHRFYQLTP
jgi:2-polyprenyl-3-methyl-5-hydroxy-6-metoxy-1,4-benzoquinol methylase